MARQPGIAAWKRERCRGKWRWILVARPPSGSAVWQNWTDVNYLILALAHAAPILVVGFMATKRGALHVTGGVMCGIALLMGSPDFVVFDLAAVGLAWAAMAQLRDWPAEQSGPGAASPRTNGAKAASAAAPVAKRQIRQQPAPKAETASELHQRQTPKRPAASAPTHHHALPTGTWLNGYHIERVLGVGGFGITYLCEHWGLGVQVAVKEYLPNEVAMRGGAEVHPKSAGDREGFEWGLERFLEEARTLARFRHPNVVRVRDCFEANLTAYIVMDYEDGEPLDALLRRHGTLTEAQLKRIALPLADGLREVHAAGFLHRDVKPANVFVRRSDETPVLLDFGSARQALGYRSRSVTAIASAGYSPPEQYESAGKQGPWTDVYALSALCYRAITGTAPVEAPRRQGELLRSRSDPLPSLADEGIADYSLAFLEAVDKGLRVIEAERPQSVGEWLAQFAESDADAAPTPASRRYKVAAPPLVPPVAPSSTAHIEPSPALMEALTKYGEAAVHFRFGFMYYSGEGVTQDHREAARWLIKAAQQGHAEAQTLLGNMYKTGEGVAQDQSEAVRWYRKAAEQEHAGAQNNLGLAYRTGVGVPRDHREAIRSFRRAAEQGLKQAQYNLGDMYYKGEGLPPNHREAIRWFRSAAEQGVAEAQNSLGVSYANGEGVPQDHRQAVQWYHSAAEQGHAFAQCNLGGMYYNGCGVARDHREAARWFHSAAEQGVAEAQNGLGVSYANGEGVPTDHLEALRWFRSAAEQGHAEAQYNLGVAHATGRGVSTDHREAAQWYHSAAEQGHARAQYNLGVMYYSGWGVARDHREAVRWYRSAAEQGHAEAQYNLGCSHANGEGVPQDHREAFRWFRSAAEQGYAEAQCSLGVSYANGEGVPIDNLRAYTWLSLAAAQGLEPAKETLAIVAANMTAAEIAKAQELGPRLVK